MAIVPRPTDNPPPFLKKSVGGGGGGKGRGEKPPQPEEEQASTSARTNCEGNHGGRGGGVSGEDTILLALGSQGKGKEGGVIVPPDWPELVTRTFGRIIPGGGEEQSSIFD